ncbi:MAG: hypothetical protein U0R76_07130 [Candidatus Nanopelagicales bacterium]
MTRRRARAAAEVEAIAFDQLRARMGDLRGDARLESLAARVVDGDLDFYAAADALVTGLTASTPPAGPSPRFRRERATRWARAESEVAGEGLEPGRIWGT